MTIAEERIIELLSRILEKLDNPPIPNRYSAVDEQLRLVTLYGSDGHLADLKRAIAAERGTR